MLQHIFEVEVTLLIEGLIGFPSLIGTGKVDDNKYYILMSYEGNEVKPIVDPLPEQPDKSECGEFIESANPITRRNEVFTMCQQMVRHLEKLHEIGYVHCDIKPSNILCKPGKR